METALNACGLCSTGGYGAHPARYNTGKVWGHHVLTFSLGGWGVWVCVDLLGVSLSCDEVFVDYIGLIKTRA